MLPLSGYSQFCMLLSRSDILQNLGRASRKDEGVDCSSFGIDHDKSEKTAPLVSDGIYISRSMKPKDQVVS